MRPRTLVNAVRPKQRAWVSESVVTATGLGDETRTDISSVTLSPPRNGLQKELSVGRARLVRELVRTPIAVIALLGLAVLL